MINESYKASFLRRNNWFELNGKWHHPFLAKDMDIDSAFAYESFKDENEVLLHDDDMGD